MMMGSVFSADISKRVTNHLVDLLQDMRPSYTVKRIMVAWMAWPLGDHVLFIPNRIKSRWFSLCFHSREWAAKLCTGTWLTMWGVFNPQKW